MLTTTTPARTRLAARISALPTSTLVACVRTIGARTHDLDKLTVRAALLAEYERRKGGTAVDRLMDEIGL